ncbi:hypothetical protein BpHYR1_019097 [Brachionus plicatilis]|uniref:Uncharacterized protein n=1 Tax=Brachionus plicatilis TaxID=10195 RepID=A0A3M7QW20_BRAPC|nr:hypothetical protein BpHYR1_019097 [Brachionus plicatilis]
MDKSLKISIQDPYKSFIDRTTPIDLLINAKCITVFHQKEVTTNRKNLPLFELFFSKNVSRLKENSPVIYHMISSLGPQCLAIYSFKHSNKKHLNEWSLRQSEHLNINAPKKKVLFDNIRELLVYKYSKSLVIIPYASNRHTCYSENDKIRTPEHLSSTDIKKKLEKVIVIVESIDWSERGAGRLVNRDTISRHLFQFTISLAPEKQTETILLFQTIADKLFYYFAHFESLEKKNIYYFPFGAYLRFLNEANYRKCTPSGCLTKKLIN